METMNIERTKRLMVVYKDEDDVVLGGCWAIGWRMGDEEAWTCLYCLLITLLYILTYTLLI
jgi:hypothetical protein